MLCTLLLLLLHVSCGRSPMWYDNYTANAIRNQECCGFWRACGPAVTIFWSNDAVSCVGVSSPQSFYTKCGYRHTKYKRLRFWDHERFVALHYNPMRVMAFPLLGDTSPLSSVRAHLVRVTLGWYHCKLRHWSPPVLNVISIIYINEFNPSPNITLNPKCFLLTWPIDVSRLWCSWNDSRMRSSIEDALQDIENWI